MALFTGTDLACAEALSELTYCNPFSPERLDLERKVLGGEFTGPDGAWHKRIEDPGERPNIERIMFRARTLADKARGRLASGVAASDAEWMLYEDVVLYLVYGQYARPFFEYILDAEQGRTSDAALAAMYGRFQEDIKHYLGCPGSPFALAGAGHLFACFFQLRRAFHHIYDNIIGGSPVSARLRAAVWQSIFTHDMRRYRRSLYNRMRDITTLVTGPSGTGKELVARAIGLSRFIPFDVPSRRFTADFAQCFYPISLSAFSPMLIESEMFGHKKGSFTGANADRTGFFELCPQDGSVFLDEIGELDPPLQVKLLRVLQTRVFQRIGDTSDRVFPGKVIAATNRDLALDMRERRFREDLYYRLCSDIIVTPRLHDQLEGSPEQLHNLLLFISRRVAGVQEAEELTIEVENWIHLNLAPDYAWPGNVRELEQCVRNIIVRKVYHPAVAEQPCLYEDLLVAMRSASLTTDELLGRYYAMVYAQTGSYMETARIVGCDRRTVKSRMDAVMLKASKNV